MDEIKLPHTHKTNAENVLEIKKLLDEDDFKKASEILKLLSDNNRLRIFWLLCHCEECVVNVAAYCDLSGPAVCHHLKALRESGLLVCRRDKKEVYYKAADSAVSRLLHKTVENIISVICPESEKKLEIFNESASEKYTEEQVEIAKKVHDYLVENLDKKITIENLSKKFLINSTTLKAVFKAVWGTSLATHIKHHRMEKAVELLKTGDKSIAEIGSIVGYTSSAKFISAFKDVYGITPLKYRKTNK